MYTIGARLYQADNMYARYKDAKPHKGQEREFPVHIIKGRKMKL